jgi:nucleotide-binding universal stress UspA family protein
MFSRVVVPLDGSAESAVALPVTRTLATGGGVTLVRVVSSTDETDQARRSLERIAPELASAGLQVDVVVRVGDPAREILDQVQMQNADLIVMRTHGRAGLPRAVLGSVTERVVADSPVPVVVLRPGGRRVSALKTLLVPIDGSPGGAVALGRAVELAEASGATIRLLQVVVPIPSQAYSNWGMLGGGVYIDPAWDEEALASAQIYVQSLVRRLRERGLSADGDARIESSVPQTIVDFSESVGADLIVMSTDALTGAARAVLGSVADEVVREAGCPVLLVRRRDAQAGAAQPRQRVGDKPPA